MTLALDTSGEVPYAVALNKSDLAAQWLLNANDENPRATLGGGGGQ